METLVKRTDEGYPVATAAPVGAKLSRLDSVRFRLAMGVGAVALVLIGAIGVGGVASATTYDPSTDLDNLASTVGTSAGPDIVTIVGDMIGIVILLFGVAMVLNFFRHRKVA
jgi:hypothetical protein